MPRNTPIKNPSEYALSFSADLPRLLLGWYDQNARPLPWRESRDPYRVWLSEIMLQQTRVEVVKAYYIRFLAELPTLSSLAGASEQKLMKLWEGLGYYSRARNLQKAAKLILSEYGGRFPDTAQGLRALPGVGPYTAGAIASICFELPVPAVDGNVLRIAARITGYSKPVDTPQAKKEVETALAAVYPAGRRGDFTQSLMELGATLCLPGGAPKCANCPVSGLCAAFRENKASVLPVRREKREKRAQELTLLLLSCGEDTAIRKRESEGLLAGLWEIPNVPGTLDAQQALDLAASWNTKPTLLVKSIRRTHVFTHMIWRMSCYYLDCAAQPAAFIWASRADLDTVFALPSAFRKFLDSP